MIDYYRIAVLYRNAIVAVIKDRKVVFNNLYAFPRGCCGYASDFLQRYFLEELNVFTWYVSGEFGYGVRSESHTWLESEDHSVVIDITGDQYKNNSRIPFSAAVYVGDRNDGFHNKFKLHTPVAYMKPDHLMGFELKKDQQYQIILDYLKKVKG